jgi:cytochrome c oxidase cbb3-type subunit 3
MKRIILLLTALLPFFALQAQTGKVYDFPLFEWYIGTMVLAGGVIIWAFYALFRLLRYMDSELKMARQKLEGTWVEPEPAPVINPYAEEPELSEEEHHSILDLLQNSVPIEQEATITLDHNYDGIRELDNALPPWWTALFYVTIGFAVVYMLHYHVLKTGPSSAQAYESAVQKAEEARLARMASGGDELNASTVTVLTDAPSLNAGQAIFMTNCATCHGQQGEGLAGAGPNMTDEYWIHGGAIGDLYTTIRYGVPTKGMIAWKDQLPPQKIQQVASYILSLQGTNPPNALEPQGERYVPAGDAPEAEPGSEDPDNPAAADEAGPADAPAAGAPDVSAAGL